MPKSAGSITMKGDNGHGIVDALHGHVVVRWLSVGKDRGIEHPALGSDRDRRRFSGRKRDPALPCIEVVDCTLCTFLRRLLDPLRKSASLSACTCI